MEYPVIIKQHLDFVVLSVPDLGITVVENLPPKNKLTPQYITQIATSLAKVWLKAQKKLSQHQSSQIPPPKPSQKITSQNKGSQKLMTSTEAAKILGISRMSIHRLVKSGTIKCIETKGGHRRFSELHLKEYENHLGRKTSPL